MKLEKFTISFLCNRTHECVSYCNSERVLKLRQDIESLYCASVELFDGFQKFVAEVYDFACFCIDSNPNTVEPYFKEDYPLFNIDFTADGKSYSFCFEYSKTTPVQWKKCAEALGEMIEENNISLNLGVFEK